MMMNNISANNKHIKVIGRLSNLQRKTLRFLEKKNKRRGVKDSRRELNSITDTRQIYKFLLPIFEKKIEHQFVDMEKRLRKKYADTPRAELEKDYQEELSMRCSLTIKTITTEMLSLDGWIELKIKSSVRSARRNFRDSFKRSLFRSLNNLVEKGLITKSKYKKHIPYKVYFYFVWDLTEKGKELLNKKMYWRQVEK